MAGFSRRCALEVDDGSEIRLNKIARIVEECPYGIHDISSVGLDIGTNLPRFNMPLELGLYLGCKYFGPGAQRTKGCLILDSERYRYRASISDISGQDIQVHHGEPARAIGEVRNWLVSISRTRGLPGGADMVDRHTQFKNELPAMCEELKRSSEDLTYADFSEMLEMWLNSVR